jgi:hypothetical protein
MALTSSTDIQFLATLKMWLRKEREILVLVRYSRAAGSKDFELVTSFEALADWIRSLSPETSMIAFRQPQLPIRGFVDDHIISRCLSDIPDGAEFLLLERARQPSDRKLRCLWRAGESREELRTELEERRGVEVAVGLYPPWLDDNADVISAVVPHQDGALRIGIY